MTAVTWEPLASHVTGLRSWQLLPGGRLHSISAPYDWTPGRNTAECRPWSGLVLMPGALMGLSSQSCGGRMDGCSCGFHAVTTSPRRFGESEAVPCGIVRGWGRVVLHRYGWRAQYADVVALTWPIAPHLDVAWRARQEEALAQAGERYGVPVYPSRAAMLDAHPVSAPGDLGVTA